MKRSNRSFAKTASNPYQSIHQQISVCAGAVAVIVSLFALTQPSEAKIVYTHANVVLSCQGRCLKGYNLDLNHDGVTDFTINVFSIPSLPIGSGSHLVREVPALGNGAIGSGGYAAALVQGAPIGHSQQFQGSWGTMAYSDYYNFQEIDHGGLWYNVTDRYLGLRFRRNGRTHYGWARLNVGDGSDGNYAILTGYAYETIADKSIKAGQKKEADDPTNEDLGPGASLTVPLHENTQPASLSMLALGARGVPLWRRNESALECAGPLNPAPIKGSAGTMGTILSKTAATHATKSDETLSNA